MCEINENKYFDSERLHGIKNTNMSIWGGVYVGEGRGGGESLSGIGEGGRECLSGRGGCDDAVTKKCVFKSFDTGEVFHPLTTRRELGVRLIYYVISFED